MLAEKFTNYDVADTLDSSDAFEGPEKTLRVYYNSNDSNEDNEGLLKIPRKKWETMLDLVKCKVLSVLVYPNVHAYVLSESSFFVLSNYIVLKTCGTTTLLAGLPKISEIIEEFEEVTNVSPRARAAFYSRRSYFNPEKQCDPHRCWDDEISLLKKHFGGFPLTSHSGVNKDERWHLFATTWPQQDASGCVKALNGGWLELMMTGLDAGLASRFHIEPKNKDTEVLTLEDSVLSLDSVVSIGSAVGAEPDDEDPGHYIGNVMTRTTGIDQLFKTTEQCIDSFAFTPCGYSCNGLLQKFGDYFTIHVTPEKGYSYASFETSVGYPSEIEDGLTHQELIERVLKLFEPAKVTLVVCIPHSQNPIDPSSIMGGKYRCTSEACFDIGSSCVTHFSLKRNYDL